MLTTNICRYVGKDWNKTNRSCSTRLTLFHSGFLPPLVGVVPPDTLLYFERKKVAVTTMRGRYTNAEDGDVAYMRPRCPLKKYVDASLSAGISPYVLCLVIGTCTAY